MHRKEVRTSVKYEIIHRHRAEYPTTVMCRFFGVSRRGYYDYIKRIGQPERDAELAEQIRKCQEQTDKTYGYRRVWKWLKNREIKKNPQTVLRVMKKYELLSEIRRRRKWVNLGHQVHKYANLLDRQFHAERPNTFATRAMESGMDLRTLSEILGHSQVALTLQLYVHSTMETKRDVMEKMDGFL